MIVDLIGLADDGWVVWSWLARRWRGRDVVLALELPPKQWPPLSWRGYVSAVEVARLRMMFGNRQMEREICLDGEELNERLRRP